MWNSALKQIWKNRKSNAWIFIEISIVSVLLWYCVDFMYVIIRKNIEPKGVNTENVYRIKLGYNPNIKIDRENSDSAEIQWINPLLQIVRLIGEYPDVEAVTYFEGTDAYSTEVMMQGYTADEKSIYVAIIRYVSEDYVKVFKVNMREGRFTNWGIKTSPQGAVVSSELADSLFHAMSCVGKSFYDYYEPELKFSVAGVCGSMKYNTYGRYEPFIYTPFNPMRLAYSLPTIAFRVRHGAGTSGFEQRFKEEMKGKLNIGPFYLFSIISYDFKADVFNTVTGISKYVNIIISMILFFMFIIFLGVLGTFWFQIESRRGEIGLRMALGSSRKGVLSYIVLESVILFTMAFIPALIVCANLAYSDITYTFNNAMDYTWSRFAVTIFFTAIIMLGIILLGVLVPARRASKVHPVEALRSE